ncbi:hypothetical protein GCM10017783_26240 [Deinococcus piscis]|uniref:Uncharacterized protein n=1 Tax=Deinococcus piscis TaxID=394230 RepID=A0ABQ3KCW9_9DEIO|nr:hypothetical protein GCM10017783_26240 [Deinococcus piscis]
MENFEIASLDARTQRFHGEDTESIVNTTIFPPRTTGFPRTIVTLTSRLCP